MQIKNAVKTILSNPFNVKSVSQYAIPTTAIHTPGHKEWREWREKSYRATYDSQCLDFEVYRESWFSEPDYLLIDVTQLKDNTWQVACYVDYHKPNLRAESEPEHLWQYAFPTEPSLQDVFIAKMHDLSELVKADFISEYRDSDNNVTITDIKERDGYTLNDYELEVTEYYRNECDQCSHFTDAQTAFNTAKYDQLLKDFKRDCPHLDRDSNEFAERESKAFEPAQLIVEIKLKGDNVTIRCCVDYGRKSRFVGGALVDILFEFTPDFLTPNENIIEQMKALMP